MNITNVVVLEIYFLGLYIGELHCNISYINISLQSYSRRISVLPTRGKQSSLGAISNVQISKCPKSLPATAIRGVALVLLIGETC